MSLKIIVPQNPKAERHLRHFAHSLTPYRSFTVPQNPKAERHLRQALRLNDLARSVVPQNPKAERHLRRIFSPVQQSYF